MLVTFIKWYSIYFPILWPNKNQGVNPSFAFSYCDQWQFFISKYFIFPLYSVAKVLSDDKKVVVF